MAVLVESHPDLYHHGADETESAFLELCLRAWYMDDTRPELRQRHKQVRRAETAGQAQPENTTA